MNLKFTKMHGCGNDYIFFDCFVENFPLENAPKIAQNLSRRHFSVGADGIVLILPPDESEKRSNAIAKMRIFNADGSEAEICGNALRCVARYLFESGHTSDTEFKIATKAGNKKVILQMNGDKIYNIIVEMEGAKIENTPLYVGVDGKNIEFWSVNVGNPHAICFDEGIELDRLAKALGESGYFPQGTNVEVATIVGENCLSVRVFERGSGETLACGSGACAVAALFCNLGLCDGEAPVFVEMRGGILKISITDEGGISMSGEATTAFFGECCIPNDDLNVPNVSPFAQDDTKGGVIPHY